MILASIESHLTDYELIGKWFTAHHFLMIMAAVVMIFLFKFAASAMQRSPKKSGMVSLLEVGMIWVRDEIVYPWLGEDTGRKYLHFFWTLFFFLLISNIIGLMPFPLNPWHRGATGNIGMTFAFALMSFIMIQVGGMKKHGWGGYWTSIVPHGIPIFLWPLMWVLEFIGLLVKPFALMVRLFANMTAGHAILAVLFSFLWGIQSYGNAAIGSSVTVATVGFMLFIFLFETLVALIQAYIFTVLTAIFLSMAVADEH